MRICRPSDYFEIRLLSSFSNLDEDYLYTLYAPLCGNRALSVYFSFLHREHGSLIDFQSYCAESETSVGEIVPSLNALEAVGLIRSFCKNTDEGSLYVFCLFAPLSPKHYFNNLLLSNTLLNKVGQNRYDQILKKYDLPKLPEDMEEISSSWTDYFSTSGVYADMARRALKTGRNNTALKIDFDEKGFFAFLSEKDDRFNKVLFSGSEIKTIEELAELYSYDENSMASFVIECFDFAKPKGERLNKDSLKQLAYDNKDYSYMKRKVAQSSMVRGNSAMAQAIKQMDKLTPIQFLSYYQRGHKPAKSDVDMIEHLSNEMGLASPALNALLFFTISTKNGQLPKAYLEKVAGSMVRVGIETSIDAINYLSDSRGKKAKKPSQFNKNETKPEEPAEDKGKEDKEYEELMEFFN